MSLIDARTVKVLVTALLFALALAFLYIAHRTLIAFLFAVFFAYLIDPAVSKLEVWVKRRTRAIAIIYLLLVGGLVTFFLFVGPSIGRQAQHLGEALPSLTSADSFQQIADKVGRQHGLSTITIERIKDYLGNHKTEISGLAQRGGVRLAEVAQQSWLLVVVPILAAFFLKDGRIFSDLLLSFAAARPQREFMEGVFSDLNQMLAHFIRAQLTLAAVTLVAYTLVLASMGVPYAMVLGTAGGLMEFVPVVGPLMAGVLIVGVALLMSYPHWLILVIFLIGWRLVQDYVISPRIMGKSVELHPLAAIFGVLAGGEIAGVLGIYLSIPVMATLRILWKRWQVYAEKRRFGPLNDYAFGTDLTLKK